jgi:hypothetical protein
VDGLKVGLLVEGALVGLVDGVDSDGTFDGDVEGVVTVGYKVGSSVVG